MSKKVTSSYALHNAQQIFESITEPANTVYYVFTAKHTPYDGGDSSIETPVDSSKYKNSVYRNMLFGKRVSANDVSYVAKRYDWEANTIYTQYDDVQDLSDEPFYAIVNAGSYYHYWKCVFNNNGDASTIAPSFDGISANDEFYETSDGYRWKYMTSVSSSDAQKFGTSAYFPVVANTLVSNAAVSGSISLIQVESGGNNYNNYIAGNNSFGSSQLRLGGNSLLYDISSNAIAASSNDYYNGCYIYIKGGSASEIGQYRKIVDYTVNTSSKTIILDRAFTNALSISAVYDIYPGVVITGTGTETSNAVARAIVNSVGNVISTVEMFTFGLGYEEATANVYAFTEVGATGSELRVIMSPPGGHGSDVFSELNVRALEFSALFSNSESNTIPTSNDYRTVGVIKDPLFANVELSVNTAAGTFIVGEVAEKITPTLLGRDGVTNTTTQVFTSNVGDFTLQFSAGDDILLVSNSNDAYLLTTVQSVTNSTSLLLASNGSFTSTSAKYYIPNCSTQGTVVSTNSTFLQLSSVMGTISTGDSIIGTDSGAYMTVSYSRRSGVNKGFDTFVGAYKYDVNVLTGEFQADEPVYETTLATSNAYFYATEVDANGTHVYLTNKYGEFSVNKSIHGTLSNTTVTISKVYNPEIVFGSGEIMYINNISPVTRAASQKEKFQIIFEF